MFDEIVLAPSIEKLISREVLVPVEYYVPSIPDLAKVKTVAGDYAKNGLEATMDKLQLVGDIVVNWIRICPDRQTVVFSSSRSHGKHIQERFLDAGISAAYLDGRTEKTERDEILRKLAVGEIQVVVNVMVLTEGWDCPPASCIILARPTKSLGLFLQMAGRGLRPHPGKLNCIIIDHSGAINQHGFVNQDFDWSLDPDEKIEERQARRKRKKSDAITCADCKHVFRERPDCPKCGWKPPQIAEPVNFIDGDLILIDKFKNAKKIKYTREEKIRFFRELSYIREQRGYKPGWAYYKYIERFGVKPVRIYEGPIPPSAETWAWLKKENDKFHMARQRLAR